MSGRPNVLLLVSDQHRFDVVGAYGNPWVKTPALDALAARGALFETCYVQNPVCAPSRASFATGQYVHVHGLWANGVALPEDRKMVSRALADSGYDCGMAGKQHLAACSIGDEPRRDDGYRVYKWSHSPNPDNQSPNNAYHRWLEANHPDIFQELLVERPRRGTDGANSSKGATPIDTVRPEAHYSHWIADEAIAFVTDESRPADQPFYFMANFFDPHHPFGAPEEFRKLYDRDAIPGPVGSVEELDSKPAVQREYSKKSYAGTAPGFQDYTEDELRETRAAYYAMVSMMDAEIQRIIDALEASGQLENTVIIYTSDHGEMLGDHALMLKGPMMYEPAIRVPLIMAWPGVVPEGVRVPAPVQNIDITSTLLEIAGEPDALPAQGASLLPMLADPAHPWRTWALTEYRDSGHPGTPPVHTTMLREGDHKLVIWHGEPATPSERDGELYDLRNDPDELVNLYHVDAHRDTREQLKDSLLDVLDATAWPHPPRPANW